MGKVEKAAADISRALELQPSHAAARVNRAILYVNMGEFEKAALDCSKALEIQPDFAAAYLIRASAYAHMGKFEKAEPDWAKAIASDPDQTEPYYMRALMRIQVQKWDEAKSDLTADKSRQLEIAARFRNEYGSVEQFEDEAGISIPDEIAELLGGREE